MMFFNPLFLQVINQPASQDVKLQKLSNSNYLFSDIIKVYSGKSEVKESSSTQANTLVDFINQILPGVINQNNLENYSSKELDQFSELTLNKKQINEFIAKLVNGKNFQGKASLILNGQDVKLVYDKKDNDEEVDGEIEFNSQAILDFLKEGNILLLEDSSVKNDPGLVVSIQPSPVNETKDIPSVENNILPAKKENYTLRFSLIDQNIKNSVQSVLSEKNSTEMFIADSTDKDFKLGFKFNNVAQKIYPINTDTVQSQPHKNTSIQSPIILDSANEQVQTKVNDGTIPLTQSNDNANIKTQNGITPSSDLNTSELTKQSSQTNVNPQVKNTEIQVSAEKIIGKISPVVKNSSTSSEAEEITAYKFSKLKANQAKVNNEINHIKGIKVEVAGSKNSSTKLNGELHTDDNLVTNKAIKNIKFKHSEYVETKNSNLGIKSNSGKILTDSVKSNSINDITTGVNIKQTVEQSKSVNTELKQTSDNSAMVNNGNGKLSEQEPELDILKTANTISGKTKLSQVDVKSGKQNDPSINSIEDAEISFKLESKMLSKPELNYQTTVKNTPVDENTLVTSLKEKNTIVGELKSLNTEATTDRKSITDLPVEGQKKIIEEITVNSKSAFPKDVITEQNPEVKSNPEVKLNPENMQVKNEDDNKKYQDSKIRNNELIENEPGKIKLSESPKELNNKEALKEVEKNSAQIKTNIQVDEHIKTSAKEHLQSDIPKAVTPEGNVISENKTSDESTKQAAILTANAKANNHIKANKKEVVVNEESEPEKNIKEKVFTLKSTPNNTESKQIEINPVKETSTTKASENLSIQEQTVKSSATEDSSQKQEFTKQESSDKFQVDKPHSNKQEFSLNEVQSTSRNLSQVDNTSTVKVVKSMELIKEISKYIKQKNSDNIVIKIDPEHLGLVKVAIETTDRFMKANIEVENEAAKKMIEGNLNQLFSSLNQNGVQLNSVNISLMNYEQKNTKNFVPKKKFANESKEPEQSKIQVEKNMGYNTYEYLV